MFESCLRNYRRSDNYRTFLFSIAVLRFSSSKNRLNTKISRPNPNDLPTDISLANRISLHQVHNLPKIPVCCADTVVYSSIPKANRLFNIVHRVVMRLNKQEHFFRFRGAVAVS